jgi:hypothetical protein
MPYHHVSILVYCRGVSYGILQPFKKIDKSIFSLSPVVYRNDSWNQSLNYSTHLMQLVNLVKEDTITIDDYWDKIDGHIPGLLDGMPNVTLNKSLPFFLQNHARSNLNWGRFDMYLLPFFSTNGATRVAVDTAGNRNLTTSTAVLMIRFMLQEKNPEDQDITGDQLQEVKRYMTRTMERIDMRLNSLNDANNADSGNDDDEA